MILGLIEYKRGALSNASLEMLTLARELAHGTDVPLEAVMIDDAASELAGELASYGVSKVYVVQHERLGNYAPEAWAQSLVQLINRHTPQAVMAIGSDRGQEVMAHVAVRTGLPMAANCIEVGRGDAYQVTRIRWGGSLLEEALLHGETKLMTVAPFMLSVEEAPISGEVEIEDPRANIERQRFSRASQ